MQAIAATKLIPVLFAAGLAAACSSATQAPAPEPTTTAVTTPAAPAPKINERRMVALYGHPSGPALGVLGEMSPADAAAEASRRAEQYQQFSAEPVIPAMEIIATVASASPGPDGDFSNESAPEELVPYIDAITAIGGYAIIDLQPGRASLLDQAKRYEELLARPNVGLALDPEWKLQPGQLPAQEVGHVEASEINDVTGWLAEFTRARQLPQKAVVLHQFQEQMIRGRETLEFHDDIALVLHADGHGTLGDKLATWDMVRQGLDPRILLAWKNFHDEDTPMLTPEQTMGIQPQPRLITYQ
ncbi:hypothetical protein HW450_12610 [Corynebacterium hindlerae]|uniref:Secreted protein n=1 Tax=Corynebacterium hindlerae TaxID=699041 RepID=A0A7G5FEV5_9CORY|nr:hypothetical protein HW450_12610 [Corynebacterium hindlerae]